MATAKNVRLNKLVGIKILLLRTQQGYSQMDVANAINCSRMQIANVEAGNTGTSLEKMILLSKLFKVPITDLIPTKKEYDPQLIDYKASKKERILAKIDELKKEADQL